jgi:hypothetical protein
MYFMTQKEVTVEGDFLRIEYFTEEARYRIISKEAWSGVLA